MITALPRRRLAALAGVVIAVLYVLWTAKHTGADIDQYADQQYFVNNLHGFVANERFPFVYFGSVDASIESSYGYTFQAIAFFVSWALASIRNDAFDPFSAGAYTDKNVMVALVSLLAFWAVYHAARSLTARRSIGVAAVALLALSPVFTGHALMNQKDVPLAVGFTALTAGTISFVGRLQRRSRGVDASIDDARVVQRFGSRRSLAWLLAIGIAFTIGTRPGSIVVVGLDVVLMVVVAVRAGAHREWKVLRAPAVGLGAGTALVLATNSAAWPNPISWLRHAIEVSRGFPNWRGKLLVDGVFHNYDAQPRWYLPFMLAVQTPVVIATLAVVAVWFLAVRAFATRRPMRATWSSVSPRLALWSPLLVQLLVLPLAGVVQGSLFYNAARQVLFVLPALAILAAVGLLGVEQLCRTRQARAIAVGVIALGMLSPLVDTVTMYPYQYAYFNELERSAGLTDRFEFDYWGLSAREAQAWVNDHYPDAVEAYPAGWQFPPFAAGTILMSSNLDNVRDREMIYASNYYPPWDLDTYRSCPVVHTVTRHLWGEEILLSYVRRCTLI